MHTCKFVSYPFTLVQLAPDEENHILSLLCFMDTDIFVNRNTNSSNGTEKLVYSHGFNVPNQLIILHFNRQYITDAQSFNYILAFVLVSKLILHTHLNLNK